jgi:hypothetical protein
MAFILRVRPDGIIEEDQTYFDEAEFLTQVGLGRRGRLTGPT